VTESIAEVGYLAGLCGRSGTDWLKVQVDSNGYLKVIGAGVAGAIEVTQDTPGDLLVGQHQYDGTNWRKSNLLWGYNDRYAEKMSNLDAVVGIDYLTSTPVPSGYVYVVSMATAWNDITDCSLVWIQATDGTIYATCRQESSPGIGVAVVWNGEIVLKQGDYMRAGFYGTVAGDDIFLCVWGYKMKVNM